MCFFALLMSDKQWGKTKTTYFNDKLIWEAGSSSWTTHGEITFPNKKTPDIERIEHECQWGIVTLYMNISRNILRTRDIL